MTERMPDHRDAELILKLHDMRREEVMRKSRNQIVQRLPRTLEDVTATPQLDHEHNRAWRQVCPTAKKRLELVRQRITGMKVAAKA